MPIANLIAMDCSIFKKSFAGIIFHQKFDKLKSTEFTRGVTDNSTQELMV